MKNPVKDMMKQGKGAIGTFVTMGSSGVSELLGKVGFDFLIIDTEHSPMDVETAQNHFQGLNGSVCAPFIRVAWNDIQLIKRALDIGAYGVVVPMVNTAEEAKKAVSYSKYPPQGVRGFGVARATNYGYGFADYIAQANAEVLCFTQVEDIKAVENIKDIVGVAGLDGIFIGPGDLAASMGHLGNWQQPQVQEAIAQVIAEGKKAGIFVGIWADTPQTAQQRLDQGCDLIAVNVDTLILAQGCRRILEDLGR